MRVAWALPALALAFALSSPPADSSGQPVTDRDLVVARLGVSALGLGLANEVEATDEYVQLRVPPGVETDDYIAQLEASGLIEDAYEDTRVFAAAEPNDPIYDGTSAAQKDYLDTIGVPEAWDLATGNQDVIVAVLDSGADLNHPDLRDQLWTNPAEIPDNGIDDDGNGCVDDVHGCRFLNPSDTAQAICGYSADGDPTGVVFDDDDDTGLGNHSHGTLVSGIAGATGNNGEGITGVAWNVKIMVVKVLDCGAGGGLPSGQMDDVRRGIEYATRMGASVINISLASAPNDPLADQPGLRAAIEEARAANVIVVAAAGNISGSNPAPGYPAAYTQYENVIGVGASDWRSGNAWAPFSRYGNGIDLAAPGTSISSTIRSDINGRDLYGIVNGGTSYAAPIVSGTFALLAARNPSLPFQVYLDAVFQTAQSAAPATHGGNWAGQGIVDAGAAIQRIPMVITGSALHDWLDIPAGALMQARVGGTVCGVTVSESFGASNISRFELTVEADAVSNGCGSPGREVRIFINGQPAVPSYPWGGQDEPLSHIGQGVSTVSPDPGPIVVQDLSPGWNNVAHFDQAGILPGALSYLPGSWTAAYTWDPLKPNGSGFGAYDRAIKGAPEVTQSWNSIQRYQAYWVDATTDTVASSVNPNPPKGRHAIFEPGWNNFVYTGTSMAIEDALENIEGLYTTVLYHDNETGEWATYIPDRARPLNGLGGLLYMRVYWIYMEKPGGFTMN